MCATCGCSDHARLPVSEAQRRDPGYFDLHEQDHDHDHDHHHDHEGHHDHDDHHDHKHGHRHLHDRHRPERDPDRSHEGRADVVSAATPGTASRACLQRLERDVVARNDRLAAENLGWLIGRGVLALNLVSSPGAGKTALLERTIRDLGAALEIRVIEGDQETARDADRIRAAGARAHQITTGTVCHLDAAMIAGALPAVDPPRGSLLVIENVGNLVCPALFDLGERAKVVVASVPEGDDKPLKYPHMFRASTVAVLNKIDLLPHVPFDLQRFLAHAREVNPCLEVFPVSALRGDGLGRWYGWLRARLAEADRPATIHARP